MSKSFAATVNTSTLTAPRISSNTLPSRGIPFWVDADTGEDMDFDIPNLRRAGRAGSPVVGVFGKKETGKTSTILANSTRMLNRQIDGRELRVEANDTRVNKDRAEYTNFARVNGCEPIPLRRRRLNLIDPKLGFSYGETLRVVKSILEDASNTTLNSDLSTALRYGTKKVMQLFPDTAELRLLSMCVRTLSRDEILLNRNAVLEGLAGRHGSNEYFQQMKGVLGIGLAHAEETEAKAEAHEHGKLTAYEYGITRVLRAAQTLADMIDDLIEGPYGEVFGGDHSIFEDLQQQVVVLDHNGLSEEAIALTQGWLWEIKNSAILREDHRLFADIEDHDENPLMWEHLAYARPMARYMKRIRATDCVLWLATHRWKDYRTVGSRKSTQYQLANNMLEDIDIHLLGRMGRKTAKEAQERFELSNRNRELLTRQPRGTWLLIIGDEQPYHVRTRLTDLELALTASNRANEANAIDDDDYDEEVGDTTWQEPNGWHSFPGQLVVPSRQ